MFESFETIKIFAQITFYQAHLAKCWQAWRYARTLEAQNEYWKAIEYCYRKLDALGALGEPSDL